MSCDNLATKEDIANLTAAIEALVTKVDGVNNEVNSLDRKIVAIKNVVDFIVSLIETLLTAMGDLSASIAEFIVTISGLVSDLQTAVIEAILAIPLAIIDAIVGILRALFGLDDGTGDIGEILRIVKEIAQRLTYIEGLIQEVGALVNFARDSIASLAARVEDIFDGLAAIKADTNATFMFVDLVYGIVLEIRDITAGLAQAMILVIDYLQNINGVTNSILDVVDYTRERIDALVQATIVIIELLQGITSTVTSNSEALTSISTKLNELKSDFDACCTAILDLLNSLHTKVDNLKEDLGVFIRDTGESLRNIGDALAFIEATLVSFAAATASAFLALTATLGTIGVTLAGIVTTLGVMSAKLAAILAAVTTDAFSGLLDTFNDIFKTLENIQKLLDLLFGTGERTLDEIYDKVVEVDECCEVVSNKVDVNIETTFSTRREVEKITKSAGSVTCKVTDYVDGEAEESVTLFPYQGINQQLLATYQGIECMLNGGDNGTIVCEEFMYDINGNSITEEKEIVYANASQQTTSVLEAIKCYLSVKGTYTCGEIEGEQEFFSFNSIAQQNVALKRYIDCLFQDVLLSISEPTSVFTTAKTVFPYDYHLAVTWYDIDKVTSRYPDTLVAGVDPTIDYDSTWNDRLKNITVIKGNVHAQIPHVTYNSPIASGNFVSEDEAKKLFNVWRTLLAVPADALATRTTTNGGKIDIQERTIRIQRLLLINSTTAEVIKCFKNKTYNREQLTERGLL